MFLEVVNRGRDQSLGLMSDARQRDLAPENWNLGDRFLLEQGFTVAFLGWQFDVQPGNGLALSVPTAPVSGVVRASAVTVSRSGPGGAIGLTYCAADPSQPDATLTFRSASPGRRACCHVTAGSSRLTAARCDGQPGSMLASTR